MIRQAAKALQNSPSLPRKPFDEIFGGICTVPALLATKQTNFEKLNLVMNIITSLAITMLIAKHGYCQVTFHVDLAT